LLRDQPRSAPLLVEASILSLSLLPSILTARELAIGEEALDLVEDVAVLAL